MQFMVEFRLKPGSKAKAVELFERRGPSRNPGVTFRGAWIGAESDQAFVLVEAADEAHVAQAAEAWREHGDFQWTRVIDTEQF